MIIDYATTDQLHVCRKIIEDAAKRGDNVGTDEWREGTYSTNLLYELSEIFQATDRDSGRIDAFMFVQYCLYQCSLDSCSATLHVFRSSSVDDRVYAELASLMGDFARELGLGYTQACVQTSLCFDGLYKELRRQGFVATIVLPDWVEISGIGVTNTVLMIKQLDPIDRQIKSRSDVLRNLSSIYSPERVFQEYTNVSLLEIPGLPLTRTSPDGTQFLLRNMRRQDDEAMFQMVRDAMDEGDGFSVYEFPSLDCFRVVSLANSYTLIIEQQDSREIVGFQLYQDAVQYRRSTRRRICESTILLKKRIRGTGLGGGLQSVLSEIGRNLGYECELRMTFVNNSRALGISRRSAVRFLGVFPRGGYLKDIGWTDLVYGLNYLTEKTKSQDESQGREIYGSKL